MRKDYFLDVVDEELRFLSRTDYFQDEVLVLYRKLVQLVLGLLVHRELQCMQLLPLALLHVMPLTLQDQHRALLQVLLQVLD
jgi:hypothetical protein